MLLQPADRNSHWDQDDCGSSGCGDGEAATRQAIRGSRHRGAHSSLCCLLHADGLSVAHVGRASSSWWGGGRQRLEYRLYASLVAICPPHLRPPCPLSPPRASLRSFLAIVVQRGALRRKTSTESALLRQFGGGTCWGEYFSRFPLAHNLFYGSWSAA